MLRADVEEDGAAYAIASIKSIRVPFGEYVRCATGAGHEGCSLLRPRQGYSIAPDSRYALTIRTFTFGAPVCFEDSIPRSSRKTPDNATATGRLSSSICRNDGWFHRHQRNTRSTWSVSAGFRAIENRRARPGAGVNMGISASSIRMGPGWLKPQVVAGAAPTGSSLRI